MAEGRSWFGEAGPPSSSTGSRCSTAPASASRRTASPPRTSSSPSSSARWRASPRPCGGSRRSTPARCGRACSTCARTCSAARSTIFARSPPDTSRVVELTVVGSINLDLVARVERLPRPGETLSGYQLRAHPRRQGRKPGGRGRAARRARAHDRRGRRRRRSPTRRSPVSRAAGVELELTRAGATGIALILVADDGENQIVVVPGANAHVDAARVGGAVLCQLEVPDAGRARGGARRRSFFALNASPARPIDVEPDLLIVNRLEHEVVSRGEARRRHLRRRRARRSTRTAARSRAHSRRASTPSTAPQPAMPSPPVSSSRCSRDDRATRRSARACAAGALAASRPGAQPSLPTAAEVDAILAA